MRELACDRAAIRLNMAAISTYASSNSILREPVQKSQISRRSILPVGRRRDVAALLRTSEEAKIVGYIFPADNI
jgi:hypothetical protein